jgi:quercetin dioxygenase-like cupin family protein
MLCRQDRFIGGSTPGGTKVAEVGPVPVFAAPEYLLRINHAGGQPGSKTPEHSHPGSESFYVLAGQVKSAKERRTG